MSLPGASTFGEPTRCIHQFDFHSRPQPQHNANATLSSQYTLDFASHTTSIVSLFSKFFAGHTLHTLAPTNQTKTPRSEADILSIASQTASFCLQVFRHPYIPWHPPPSSTCPPKPHQILLVSHQGVRQRQPLPSVPRRDLRTVLRIVLCSVGGGVRRSGGHVRGQREPRRPYRVAGAARDGRHPSARDGVRRDWIRGRALEGWACFSGAYLRGGQPQ